MTRITWPRALAMVGVGLVAGYLSGLFGVGGGVVVVPFLVWLGYDIKRASAVSLGAVLLSAIAGVITYAATGHVDWVLALLLALGSVAGAQLGSRLLGKLPARTIQLGFAVFMLLAAVSLLFTVPSRSGSVHIDLLSAVLAVVLGFVVGVLSAILGIGGGVMIVPALILGFGANDLVARGTSIATMIPTSISGTIGHIRAGRADLLASLFVGLGAVSTTTLGALTAKALDPRVGNVLIGVLLVAMAIQLAWRARRRTVDTN